MPDTSQNVTNDDDDIEDHGAYHTEEEIATFPTDIPELFSTSLISDGIMADGLIDWSSRQKPDSPPPGAITQPGAS